MMYDSSDEDVLMDSSEDGFDLDDDEFLPQEQRSRKRRRYTDSATRRDEAIYGIFGGGDSEFSSRRRGHGSGESGVGRVSASAVMDRPLQFVSAGVFDPNKERGGTPGSASTSTTAGAVTATASRSSREEEEEEDEALRRFRERAGMRQRRKREEQRKQKQHSKEEKKESKTASNGEGRRSSRSGLGGGRKAKLSPHGLDMDAVRSMDAEFGKFEQHTKGFGMKMLMKMGFTGRLGAKADGTVNPIRPVVRPDRRSLGYGSTGLGSSGSRNSSSAPSIAAAHNSSSQRRLPRHRRRYTGDREDDSDLDTEAVMDSLEAEYRRSESLWRKTQDTEEQQQRKTKTRGRKKWKTAADLIAESAAEAEEEVSGVGGERGGMTIIDMTGPQARVVPIHEYRSSQAPQLGAGVRDEAEGSEEDFMEVAAQLRERDDDDGDDDDVDVGGGGGRDAVSRMTASALPELQHNLNLLVELCEDDIRTLASRIQHEQRALQQSTLSGTRGEASTADQEATTLRFQRVLEICVEICDRFSLLQEQDASMSSLPVILEALACLESAFQRLYHPDLLPALLRTFSPRTARDLKSQVQDRTSPDQEALQLALRFLEQWTFRLFQQLLKPWKPLEVLMERFHRKSREKQKLRRRKRRGEEGERPSQQRRRDEAEVEVLDRDAMSISSSSSSSSSSSESETEAEANQDKDGRDDGDDDDDDDEVVILNSSGPSSAGHPAEDPEERHLAVIRVLGTWQKLQAFQLFPELLQDYPMSSSRDADSPSHPASTADTATDEDGDRRRKQQKQQQQQRRRRKTRSVYDDDFEILHSDIPVHRTLYERILRHLLLPKLRMELAQQSLFVSDPAAPAPGRSRRETERQQREQDRHVVRTAKSIVLLLGVELAAFLQAPNLVEDISHSPVDGAEKDSGEGLECRTRLLSIGYRLPTALHRTTLSAPAEDPGVPPPELLEQLPENLRGYILRNARTMSGGVSVSITRVPKLDSAGGKPGKEHDRAGGEGEGEDVSSASLRPRVFEIRGRQWSLDCVLVRQILYPRLLRAVRAWTPRFHPSSAADEDTRTPAAAVDGGRKREGRSRSRNSNSRNRPSGAAGVQDSPPEVWLPHYLPLLARVTQSALSRAHQASSSSSSPASPSSPPTSPTGSGAQTEYQRGSLLNPTRVTERDLVAPLFSQLAEGLRPVLQTWPLGAGPTLDLVLCWQPLLPALLWKSLVSRFVLPRFAQSLSSGHPRPRSTTDRLIVGVLGTGLQREQQLRILRRDSSAGRTSRRRSSSSRGGGGLPGEDSSAAAEDEQEAVWECLMLWTGWIDPGEVQLLLIQHFFPGWLGRLARWLATPQQEQEQEQNGAAEKEDTSRPSRSSRSEDRQSSDDGKRSRSVGRDDGHEKKNQEKKAEREKIQEIWSWYRGWRNLVPPDIRNLAFVQEGFALGLDLMNLWLQDGIPGVRGGLPQVQQHLHILQSGLRRQLLLQQELELQKLQREAAAGAFSGVTATAAAAGPGSMGGSGPLSVERMLREQFQRLRMEQEQHEQVMLGDQSSAPTPQRAAEEQRKEKKTKPSSSSSSSFQIPSTKPRDTLDQLSFRDIVSKFAEMHSLGFLPTGRSTTDGKPLYSFGGIPVYLDRQSLYAKSTTGAGDGRSGAWEPISLPKLLQRARAQETRQN